MAKIVMVEESLTGDLKREGELDRVVLSVGNDKWALYLSDQSKTKLMKALEPFTARETVNDPDEFPRSSTASSSGPKVNRAGRSASKYSSEELAAIRAWAAENGHEVAPVGRIAKKVSEAWVEAGSPMEFAS